MNGFASARWLCLLLVTTLSGLAAQAFAADRVGEQRVVSGALKAPLSLTAADREIFFPRR